MPVKPTDRDLGHLEGVVEVIRETVSKVEREIDAHLEKVDSDLQKLRDEVRDLAAAVREQKPQTGELHILGRRWSRVQTAVLAGLIAILAFLGQSAWVRLAEAEREIGRIETELVELQAFARVGPRVTVADILVLFECVGFRFDERLQGVEAGAPLRPGDDPAALEQIRECADELRARRLEMLARLRAPGAP